MAMSENPFRWVEIYVEDMERAKRFYTSVFEMELSEITPESGPPVEMWGFPMEKGAPGAAGALVKMDGVAPGGGGVVPYFSSADCSIEIGRVVRAGGKVLKEKFSIGQYGFIALGYDSEGNVFGVHSLE